MADDFSARQTYSMRIIQLWLECIDFSQEAQKFILRNEPENDVVLEYVARLVRLWREFVPKVRNRPELKELEKEFFSFESYCTNPETLLTEPLQIRLLEAVLTDVLDRLGLTKLENMR